ncbi:hypothetical protein [Paenibacillus sacheonensis]|uniref:Uncharacterized protein n=1 Tax=Paenibacillus sacheonensis TaxID=742054 RepID=A0A7X4YKN8_9BACL|nr:hypothetical protein [Paenibacillus sacheonensis]MBM7564231.1 hypothetical protein [Paenibacillus sacheonensis]NBC67446.1 hypothetical protein [Paenibacillus sacheonensis]
MTMIEAVRAGNVVRENWPVNPRAHLSLYLGSGSFGGCFDEFGLMNNGYGGAAADRPGSTFLMHADHWDGTGNQQVWLPLMRLAWLRGYDHGIPQTYRQTLDLYTGLLETALQHPGLQVTIRNRFHPGQRDLMGLEIAYTADDSAKCLPPIILALEAYAPAGRQQEVLRTTVDQVTLRVRSGTADTAVALRAHALAGELRLLPTDAGIEMRFGGDSGHFFLLIGAASYERVDGLTEQMNGYETAESFAEAADAGWQARWGDAYIAIPVAEHQALWARSLYYVFCSYSPDVRCPAPPGGWTGDGWGYSFPQDLSYIHPALLRLGHLDIAKAWVEFYARMIDGVRAFTKESFGADGTMWIWEFPIGMDWNGFADGAPNRYHYEIHNAAYPARMARETALYLGDADWTLDVCWPIVRESARFYASVLAKEEDGGWGIHLTPSMGQDESGGQNQWNYLCSLFSAEYCLRTAAQLAGELAAELGVEAEEAKRWNEVLEDGLAYERLLDREKGIYRTYENQQLREQTGRQKHPVQLNPLFAIPLGRMDDRLRQAYRNRYDLCVGATGAKQQFEGWTLPAFLIASAHAGDSAGLSRGLSELVPSTNVSPEWLQIYESSLSLGYTYLPYYTTSHGLYLQAVQDAIIHDYHGEIVIGSACPAEWAGAAYHNLRFPGGRKRSGVVEAAEH